MIRSIIPGILVGATALWLAQPASAAEGTTTTAADVSRQTGEAWNTIKAYSQDKKDEAVAYGKQLLKDTDAKIAELVLQLAKEDSTERHGFLDGLGLRPAGASRELLRQLYLLGADGISRADLTADLFDGEIAALAPDAFERHLRHLQRIGVLDIRHDPDESTAGSSRATIVVDNLAASALFG